MNTTPSLIAAAAAAWLAGTAVAQDVAACRSIEDSLERLTCYDAIPLPDTAPPDIDTAFGAFRDLVRFGEAPTGTGPYGAEVDRWNMPDTAHDWLRATYDYNAYADIHLLVEDVMMEDCTIALFRTWRIRLRGSGGLDRLPASGQPLVSYHYVIPMRWLDIEATEAVAGDEVIMQRGFQVFYGSQGRAGWQSPSELNPVTLLTAVGANVDASMVLFTKTSDRSPDVRMGRAWPEDRTRIRAAFLDLARACQQG